MKCKSGRWARVVPGGHAIQQDHYKSGRWARVVPGGHAIQQDHYKVGVTI
jgi:predicted ABC-type ATPase